MNEAINNGGPAFPVHPDISEGEAHAGMKLRDYFAAKAMQGFLAHPMHLQSGADMFARDAYVIADAMLKAR